MGSIANILAQGVMLGAIYGMIAMGLSLVFGVARIVNFAHGAMLALAMYLAYTLAKGFGVDPYLSVVPVGIAVFLVGYAVQKWLVNPVLEREAREPDLPVILLTTGLMLFIENALLFVYGANFLTLGSVASNQVFKLGEISVPLNRLVAAAAALVLLFGVNRFLHLTDIGRAVRAVAQNPQSAALMGINVRKVLCVAFGMGCGLAAMAAVLVAPLYYVHPSAGNVFLAKSFVIVVLGGLGSVGGAFLGGVLVGLVETSASQAISVVASDALVMLLFVAVLVLRPSGLLGRQKK